MHPIRTGLRLVASVLFALALTGVARAQISERNIPASPPVAHPSSQPTSAATSPAPPGLVTSRASRSDSPQAPVRSSAETGETGSSAPVGAAKRASGPAPMQKYFPYTVASGDTLGKIAQFFGVSVDALAKANRIHPDTPLYIGDRLKIPNPFEAESAQLRGELSRITNDDRAVHAKLTSAQAQIASLKDHSDSLTASNAALKHEARVLPWWRGAAIGIGAAALLMFGVTILTLFEWWMLRRRFLAVSDLAVALGHLDVKYKETLAKAELRMQQLYGRRRPVAQEGIEHSVKTQEEIEIERLNRQLRAVLEEYLERLGMRSRRAKRSARLGEILGDTDESAARARELRR